MGVSVSGSTVIASAWDEASSIVTARSDQYRSVLDAATGRAIGGTWVTLPAGTHFQTSNGHLITQQPGLLVVHFLAP